MLPRYQVKVWLIVLIVLVIVTGCTRNAQVAPAVAISTSTETPSPIPTLTSTATPNSVATSNFIETASIGTLIATVQPRVIADYPSRDGKWRVEIIRYDCAYVYHDYSGAIAYEQLKLINLNNNSERVMADQKQNCGGLGAYGLQGLYWSPQNRYFYYNDSREGYPDGGCGNYIPTIYRLDPVTQEVIVLERSFLSPDKTKLALWQGNEIVIWDLDKGEIARVEMLQPELTNGRMWWSKKGNSILYLQTEFECAPYFGKSYLVSLDPTNLSQTLITNYELTNTGFVSTPAPTGVFVFFFYSPIIMNYDPSIWEIKNILQAKELASCYIAEQGPTDFNGPHTSKFVQLGDIRYEVLSFPDAAPDMISHVYVADQAHATEYGLPIIWVSATPNEWDKCKVLAEEVLATLHFPFQ